MAVCGCNSGHDYLLLDPPTPDLLPVTATITNTLTITTASVTTATTTVLLSGPIRTTNPRGTVLAANIST